MQKAIKNADNRPNEMAIIHWFDGEKKLLE